MEAFKKVLSYRENFNIWRNYELMLKNKDIIITFINNNILTNDSMLFKQYYEDYKKTCDIFYKSIVECINTNKTISNYNINFLSRELEYFLSENEQYDLDIFAINTLELIEKYKQLVLDIIAK